MQSSKNVCDEIARVAYELFEKRGGAHGYHFEDWLEAERIVLARHIGEVERVAEAVKTTRKRKAADDTVPKARKTTKKTAGTAIEPTKKRSTTKRKTE